MATNKDSDLIGYDPLAWLGIETEDVADSEQLLTQESPIVDSQMTESEVESKDDLDEVTENIVEIEPLAEDDESWVESDFTSVSKESEEIADSIMDEDDVTEAEEIAMETESIASIDDVGEENNEWVDVMAEQEISPIVDLDSTLTIQHVGALHEKLKLCLAMHDQIEINASDVSAIDTANLQLLVALKKDAANLQKQVSIIYPSPRFIESAQLLGLLDILEVTP